MAHRPNDLGIDSDGAIAAATAFQGWVNSGLITPSLDYDGMIAAFAEGRAPFAITGPWAVPTSPTSTTSSSRFPGLRR